MVYNLWRSKIVAELGKEGVHQPGDRLWLLQTSHRVFQISYSIVDHHDVYRYRLVLYTPARLALGRRVCRSPALFQPCLAGWSKLGAASFTLL